MKHTPLEALKILQASFTHTPDNPKGNVHKTKIITTCPDVREALNIARQTQWDAEKQEEILPEVLAALEACYAELNQLAFLSGDKLAKITLNQARAAINKARTQA